MALAAEALGVPVVSGNVSLYNETDGRAIPPTPVVGCVGLVPDIRVVPSRWREGDVVLVAGEHDPTAPLDLQAEARLVEFLWRAAPLLSLAHDVSEGGLAAALAEAALWSGLGAEVDLPECGGAVIACAPEDVTRLGGVPLREIGAVGGGGLLGFGLAELRKAYG
jgi:phosphoribosylformylglycinamidine synthase subunit PurL